MSVKALSLIGIVGALSRVDFRLTFNDAISVALVTLFDQGNILLSLDELLKLFTKRFAQGAR